jgi:magnesium-transporting ATPase (P-type)
MLWVNIIMDTLGALAFASEPPLKEYMRQKPIKREEKILARPMIFEIITVSSYVLFLCVWFLKSDTGAMILSNGSEKYMLSAFFALFVFTGVFVCFTSRAKGLNIMRGLYKNKAFLPIMAGVMLVQIAFIYFGGEALRAMPLKFGDLIDIILVAFTVIIFDTVRKIFVRLFSISRKKSKQKFKIERKITNVK